MGDPFVTLSVDKLSPWKTVFSSGKRPSEEIGFFLAGTSTGAVIASE